MSHNRSTLHVVGSTSSRENAVVGSDGTPLVLSAADLADLADTYARQADELAAMVEAENERAAWWHATVSAALGELHTALDQIAHLVAGMTRAQEGVTSDDQPAR